jgi:hypothetical protein
MSITVYTKCSNSKEAHKVNYHEFLKADILCLLHDYGAMTAQGVNSMLGSDIEEVKNALDDLLIEKKAIEIGEDKYSAVDEVNVKRLKKALPSIF